MIAHTHAAVFVESPEGRARLGRRAQLLAAASVAYNGLEAIIAIAAGLFAGSIALVGFGLDSIVEVSSGLIILWQFRHRMPEARERRAGGDWPRTTRGLPWLAAAIVVMLYLVPIDSVEVDGARHRAELVVDVLRIRRQARALPIGRLPCRLG